MPITTLSRQIKDLRDQLELLRAKYEDNEELIKQMEEDLNDIVTIVSEHAQRRSDEYVAPKPPIDLPTPQISAQNSGDVSIPEIVDTIYKID